jgi:hypothetical protein
MSGKGDSRRPVKVPQKQVDDNWDKIFGKKKEEEKKPSFKGRRVFKNPNCNLY